MTVIFPYSESNRRHVLEPIGAGLPEDFLLGERSAVLITLAALFTDPDPRRVNALSQALAVLALYGAGARISLSEEEYRGLKKTGEAYKALMEDSRDGNERNKKFASFILRCAYERRMSDASSTEAGSDVTPQRSQMSSVGPVSGRTTLRDDLQSSSSNAVFSFRDRQIAVSRAG